MASDALPRRFSALDAIFIDIESPSAPMHIGSVCVYEGQVSLDRLSKHIASRIHRLPRYRQIMVPTPLHLAYPSWQTDPRFDIRRHVRQARIPNGATDAQLRTTAARILSSPLDRDKPLWELFLLSGLAGGHFAIVSKVHHCLADGISGVELASVMHDHLPREVGTQQQRRLRLAAEQVLHPIRDAVWDTAIEEVTRWSEAEQGVAKFLSSLSLDTLGGTWKEVLGIVRTFSLPIDRMPFNVHRLSGKKRLAWLEFSFAEVRGIRAALGGTVNDALLTVVGLAVRRYLKAHGIRPTRKTLRVMVPVSLRREDERGRLGNRVSMLPVQIPLGIGGPVELFRHIREHTTRLKEARVADALFALFRAAQFGPLLQSAIGRLARTSAVNALLSTVSAFPTINTVVTNVPGPQIPLYLLGHRMIHYYPYLPVAPEVSATFGILSYDQKLAISVIADAAAMPDIKRMGSFLNDAYRELRDAAKVIERPHVHLHRRSRTK